MRKTRVRFGGVMYISGILAAGGCGDGVPSASRSTEEATVSGRVTVRGKPVEGTVTFDPANISRKDAAMRTAAVDKEGRYATKTLVGENRVTFASPRIARDPKLANPTTTLDVQAGENTHDIDLKDADSSMLTSPDSAAARGISKDNGPPKGAGEAK